jgi:FAD/FMN-containing dehydrogenase
MLGSWFRRHRASVSVAAIVVAAASVYGFRKLEPLAADPIGEKDCAPMPGGAATATRDTAAPRAIPPLDGVRWKQVGGTINDASCLNRVDVYGIVDVQSVDDVRRTLAFARQNRLKVSVAGVRHSMGGHAFRRSGIVLDMTRFNRIALNEAARTVTVQAGATWHDIQNVLHPKFAVRAMQSTDIFTVGGSISVNAHGMDHHAGAMANSIRAMRVMRADGTVEEISRSKNPDLFNLVVGGYGLFGVILDAELDVADNAIYQTGRRFIDYREFPALFAREFETNRAVALMYAHLSTAPRSFLRDAVIYTYTEADGGGAQTQPLDVVSAVKLRRLVMNLSKQNALFKEIKWFSEKNLEPRMERCTVTRAQAMASGEACLVSRNDPMHDSVPYLRNNLKDDTDILHEYFVPRDRLIPFIDGMREVLERNQANLLNASIRVVHKEENFLTYAPGPAFSVVLYINQSTDEAGNRRMKKLTEELIDLTIAQGGRFFLPYQLYYSPAQLQRAYPQIGRFFAAKRRYDPDGLLTNTFYQTYGETTVATR